MDDKQNEAPNIECAFCEGKGIFVTDPNYGCRVETSCPYCGGKGYVEPVKITKQTDTVLGQIMHATAELLKELVASKAVENGFASQRAWDKCAVLTIDCFNELTSKGYYSDRQKPGPNRQGVDINP